ncbi:MAG: trehalose-phosphatase, partial [candidate division NC10 bacterium]|nr:trehalose-phosphatase [candidate division NC10 bacterium]
MARPLLGQLNGISSQRNPESPLCLLLDFDGTLAPLRRRPEEARISTLTRSLLQRLSGLERVYVGIISGRSRQDLYRKVGVPKIYYGGCHGLEMKGPGFSYRHPGAARARPFLARIARELKEQTGTIPGAMVEDKGLSVSLHYRNVKRKWVPLLREEFHRVIEGS